MVHDSIFSMPYHVRKGASSHYAITSYVRNITPDLLTEICKDVPIEPSLQTITGEEMPKGSITSNEARLDVSARDFWIPYQKAFFDIRVFNPLAGRYGNMSIEKAHEINEKEKKAYNERVIQIEHGSFTPLVFCSNGGKGRECRRFYQRLSQMIAEKRRLNYNIVTNWINRKISFALNNCIIICVRGSRSLRDQNLTESNDIEIAEAISQINF